MMPCPLSWTEEILKIGAARSFKTMVTIYQSTKNDIAEDLILRNNTGALTSNLLFLYCCFDSD